MMITPGVPSMNETSEAPDQQSSVDDAEDGDDLEVARELAGKLNAAEERWFVMYGAGSRSYWAFPLWDPGTKLILEADSADRLLKLMRKTELRSSSA